LRLFLERAADLAVHPPTAELAPEVRHICSLVPKPDAPVNALVQIVAGKQLMLVEPAADALPMNLPGVGLISSDLEKGGSGERFVSLGGSWSLFLKPVMQQTRFRFSIELCLD